MPIYDYSCECGSSVSLLRKIDDMDDPVLCENCHSIMTKCISAPSIIMKGESSNRDNVRKKLMTAPGNGGMITKQPIIKDRNTGRTLYGPDNL